MEQLKHECGVAMIRLLRPLEYYKEKYGTYLWGLNKLYLMMEKQHNRGQEAAGVGVVKMHAIPGYEYVFRERALGSGAISEIFSSIMPKLADVDQQPSEWVERFAPFLGEVYMGHLRYSTTGRSGMSYVHPFLRRNNWRSRNLLMCGNFNLTNVDQIYRSIVDKGEHPRLMSDSIMLIEGLGYALDKENHRLYRQYRDTLSDPALSYAIEDNLDLKNILKSTAPEWDGGYVICGAVGSGDMFVLRDPAGIRPAFYYADDEVVVVASERPVIQTAFDAHRSKVIELEPGSAITVRKNGEVEISQVLPKSQNKKCSFERIYFSRGSDADIYNERKSLGRELVKQLDEYVGNDLQHTVFGFIPNTAEVAYIGMVEGFNELLDQKKADAILALQNRGELTDKTLAEIMSQKLRVEKIAIKDIKLRTFIAEGSSRNDLAAHVYDVTYGLVENDVDTIVVIDDSIVRGTTLQQSILRMLDRLHPCRIIVVSSSPQVRYPDYYGIDMSRMSEFIAFRAAVRLLKESGREDVLRHVYEDCKAQLMLPDELQRNAVKAIYEPFSDEEISRKIVEIVTGSEIKAKVEIVYQTIEGLHKAIPDHPGDWYFTGDYPTPGGIRLVNRAYVNYFEGNPDAR